MDPAHVGREVRAAEPYVVGREKVREFATAIGDTTPLSHSVKAARGAGYPDVVASPTFAVAVVSAPQDRILFDPELGLDFSRVVHGDQQFSYHRPIVAGDILDVVVRIDTIRNVAGNDMITLRSEVTDATGAPVVTCTGLLVSRAS